MRQDYDNFRLEKVNLGNIKHLVYIKRLIKDKDVQKELFINLEDFENSNDDIKTGGNFIALIKKEPKVYLEFGPFSRSGVSLSIGVLKEDRHNNYAFLVLNELLPSIFEQFNINEISVIISKNNLSSINLFQKLGFIESPVVGGCYKLYKDDLEKHEQNVLK